MQANRMIKSGQVASPAVASLPDGGFLHSAQKILMTVLDSAYAWQQRASDRRALAKLDDRMLSDIGIDRATADREASKPFWMV